MSENKVVVAGKDFRQLIAAVTKFPSLGAFAESEIVSLRTSGSYLVASALGVVLSKAQVSAQGVLPLVGMDERLISQFASIQKDKPVTITTNGKEIHIRGWREITAPVAEGQAHKLPAPFVGEHFSITESVAERVKYLSGLAFGDSSKAELCAVMLDGKGNGVACNPKAICVLSCKAAARVALPVILASNLSKGDKVFFGPKETVVESGIAWYCMPSPSKAQNEFPLDAVHTFGKSVKEPIGICKGSSFAHMIAECNSCLGSISKTAVVLCLTVKDGRLILESENGGAKFKASVQIATKLQDCTFRIPMEDAALAVSFLEKEAKLDISQGKHGEVFFQFADGWLMFPSWSGK